MKTTIHDVARAAGVSASTVSRALSNTGRISERTRSLIVRTAVELNYESVNLARSLRERSDATLAVMIPSLDNPFMSELLKGITQVADANGYTVVVAATGIDAARNWATLTNLRRRRIAGMVVVESNVRGDALRAVTAGIPVVIFDRDYGLPTASTICADQTGAGRFAAEHLVRLGHRRIVHLRGPEDQPVAGRRVAGVVEALDAVGLEPRIVPSGWTEDEGYQSTRRLLDENVEFTAVVAASDVCAIGALTALEEADVRVPADVSVIGFDDIHLASFTHPRLTTVRQDGPRLGAAAATMIAQQLHTGILAAPTHETIPVELIVRESTSAVEPGRAA